jgi:hypothetical protein
MMNLAFLLGKTKKQSKKTRAEEQQPTEPAQETVLSDFIEIVSVSLVLLLPLLLQTTLRS